MIVVLSVMTALNENIEQRTLRVEPHLTVTFPGNRNHTLVKADPVVAKFSDLGLTTEFFERQDVIIKTNDGRFRGAMAVGLDQQGLVDFFKRLSKPELMPETMETDDIIVGSDLAASLGLFEGDMITLFPPENLLVSLGEALQFDRARVAKIVTTDIADVDGQMMIFDHKKSLAKLRGSPTKILGYNLWLKSPNKVDQIKKTLMGFQNVSVETWKERNAALLMSLRLEKMMITIFLSLASLIAGISMISALVLLISQKRKEIAIMQTMGFSRANVQKLFFKMGFYLASSGLVVGVVIGTSISLYLQWFPLHILPDIYYDASIEASVRPKFVVSVMMIGLIVSAAGSYWVSKQTLQTSIRNLLQK